MSAGDPWRYVMPCCGSHAWSPVHTENKYRCNVCGSKTTVLFDKKRDRLVSDISGAGTDTQGAEPA